MRHRKVIPGVFLQRPNRFIAYCEIDGNVEKCHVKNTGTFRHGIVLHRRFQKEIRGRNYCGGIPGPEAFPIP